MKRKKMNILLISILIIIAAYLPHVQKGMFHGADDIFHYHRIFSIAEALKQGVFPVKVHATAAYGYGYGVGFFYSNALLYIPALLIYIFNMPLMTAYKIFALLVYTSIYIAMYYSIWKLTYNHDSAFFAASMLLFSNKVMESFYTTIAIGQMTAFIFAPMAIVGMYIFLVRDEKPYLLMAGFIGLIYSHTISTFLSFIVCLWLVLIHIEKLLKKKSKIIYLICSVAVVTAVTAAFWLPMLEQMKAQWLKVKAPWTTSENNVATIKTMIIGKDGIGYLIFIVFLLCIGIVLFSLKEKNVDSKLKETICSFLIIAVAMALITTWYPFWHFMNSVLGIKLLQFPSRMNMMVTILILCAGGVLYSVSGINLKMKRIIGTLVLMLGIVMSYVGFSEDYLKIDNDKIEQVLNNEVAGLGAGEEWLPLQTDREEMIKTNTAVDNEGNSVVGLKSAGYTKYMFEADLSKEYYTVPYVWYKGFGAEDSRGNRYDISQDVETGLVQVLMPKNAQGTEEVTVYYVGTKYQKLAYGGTAIAIGMLAIYMLLWNNKLWKNCCLNLKKN